MTWGPGEDYLDRVVTGMWSRRNGSQGWERRKKRGSCFRGSCAPGSFTFRTLDRLLAVV